MSDSDPRRHIRHLLDDRDPADAPAAYYALYHDPRRTRLYAHDAAPGVADGFLAVCQTGLDLFRPLAVLKVLEEDAVAPLLQQGLVAGRPYFLIGPAVLQSTAGAAAELSAVETYRLFTVAEHDLRPVINVLVQREPVSPGSGAGTGAAYRWLIRGVGDDIAAIAGVNWRSPRWAEVYVQVHAGARGRGLGRSVISACTTWLLEQGIRPLYLVAGDNIDSIALAEGLGYHDTGKRLFMAQAVRSE